MHENEGADSVVEDGKKRFTDEDLPGTPGTIMNAEFANALMEEFRNILARAGMAFEPTAAEDRAAGWIQLSEAIFNSAALTAAALATSSVINSKLAPGAVTDDKVINLNLAKMYGVLELLQTTESITQSVKLNYEELQFLIDLGGDEIVYSLLNGGGLTVENNDGRATKYLNGGMRRVGAGEEAAVGMAVFDMSTTGTWDDTVTWYGVCTGLPKTERILHAYVTLENSADIGDTAGDGVSIYDGPEIKVVNGDNFGIFDRAFFTSVDTSDDWQVQVQLYTPYNTTGYGELKLHVVFA